MSSGILVIQLPSCASTGISDSFNKFIFSIVYQEYVFSLSKTKFVGPSSLYFDHRKWQLPALILVANRQDFDQC